MTTVPTCPVTEQDVLQHSITITLSPPLDIEILLQLTGCCSVVKNRSKLIIYDYAENPVGCIERIDDNIVHIVCFFCPSSHRLQTIEKFTKEIKKPPCH